MTQPAEEEARQRTEALRVQRALEEVLDRLAGQPAPERADAVQRATESEIQKLDPADAGPVLDLLDSFYDEGASSPVASPRVAELEERVKQLEAELQAARAAPAGGDPAFVRSVAQILLGSEKRTQAFNAEGREAEERLLEQLKVLVSFTTLVGQAFLGITAEPDATMSGRIQNVLGDELTGRASAGTFKALLSQVQHQISNQILAFREACEVGAQNLLRQVAPAAIAAEAARESGGWRLFSPNQVQWEKFEAKFDDLRRADNLFETYFDGAFRKAVLRLTRDAEERP